MNGLILTHRGLEHVAKDELLEIVPKAKVIEILPGRIVFECKTHDELADLIYYGRTFSKILQLFVRFPVKDDEIPPAELFKEWDSLPFIDKTAVVLCDRDGAHAYTSVDVENVWNAKLKERNITPTYRNAQTQFLIVIDQDKGYFCLDLCGIDLGKREYRIFLGAESLKGDLTSGILRMAKYSPKETLLDPFCRHGIIPIEAALLAKGTSVQKFGQDRLALTKLPGFSYKFKDKEKDFSGVVVAMDDNFKHVAASKKNAKIAGIIKEIEFSRTDLKWIDAKFGKNSIDKIITFPQQPSKSMSPTVLAKIYEQVFYQAEFILKKAGKLCLLMRERVDALDDGAKKFGFELKEDFELMQGAQPLYFLIYAKKGK